MESSLTRDQTHVPCIGRQILIHCGTREVLKIILFLSFCWLWSSEWKGQSYCSCDEIPASPHLKSIQLLISPDFIIPPLIHYSYFFFNFSFSFFLILKSLILTCIPKHEPPSHFPPHNISLGHPHAPTPSMLYPASDIDWQFNSYMIVYMIECHSPKSSHPLPLPLSPKVHYH